MLDLAAQTVCGANQLALDVEPVSGHEVHTNFFQDNNASYFQNKRRCKFIMKIKPSVYFSVIPVEPAI